MTRKTRQLSRPAVETYRRLAAKPPQQSAILLLCDYIDALEARLTNRERALGKLRKERAADAAYMDRNGL